MSTAVDAADAAAPPKKSFLPGKKKLLMLLAGGLLLAAVGTGGAVWWLKKKAKAADEGEAEVEVVQVEAKEIDAKQAPTFVPLDVFTVNLADREAERYAQIGITFELADPKAGDAIKAYMPAIRNNILMVLAHKSSDDLLAREGKARLAAEVRREASRALGVTIEDDAAAAPAAASGASAPAKKKAKQGDASPIRTVHFAQFIIQ